MDKKWMKGLVIATLCAMTWSCGSNEEPKKQEEKQDETADASAEVQAVQTPVTVSKKAFAVLNPKEKSEVVGAVTFTQVDGGVRIVADVGGLTPGKHGFHLHEKGDCSAEDGSSAGGHFNPTNKKHGGPESAERHVGDLGNLEANQDGFAHYDRVDTMITLDGVNSIIGKSVVVHEKEDDLKTDPTGNSGKRLSCGVIVEAGQPL